MESKQNWKSIYRAHLIVLERFLARKPANWINSEKTVYLCGMLARHTDLEYQKQIESFLLEDPEQLEAAIRRHDPYLGQNAPLVTLSRINGEHLTIALAFELADGQQPSAGLRASVSSRYFGVAAFYSREAGNRQLSQIFAFFQHHQKVVLDLLSEYLGYIARPDFQMSERIPAELWEKFKLEKNERNQKKDWWERRGITLGKKESISSAELRQMLNHGTLN